MFSCIEHEKGFITFGPDTMKYTLDLTPNSKIDIHLFVFKVVSRFWLD